MKMSDILFLPVFPDVAQMPHKRGYEGRQDNYDDCSQNYQILIRHSSPC